MTTTMSQLQASPAPQMAAPVPPTSDGAGLQTYEAQFLGEFLGTLVDTTGPVALKWLRDQVGSMGVQAQDTQAVAAAVNQYQAQFFGAIAPFIPIAVDVVGRLVKGAASGQAAGGASTQSAGAGSAQVGSIPPQQQQQPQYSR